MISLGDAKVEAINVPIDVSKIYIKAIYKGPGDIRCIDYAWNQVSKDGKLYSLLGLIYLCRIT